MGWGNCGTDRNGRPIGYVFDATCDHPGCTEAIDRGLSYACGDMHGEDECSCDKYFCEAHRRYWVRSGSTTVRVCDACQALLADPGSGWQYDAEEGVYFYPGAD